jgi:hypothetical protein
MPGAKISVKARLVTLIFGIFVAKIYDAALAEGPFGHGIFPLPFSILVSGMLAVSGVVPLLYIMTPTREKFAFGRMNSVLCAYWVSLLIVIVWAVGIQRLMGRSFLWQSAWTFAYGPLRFVCKILLAAPITTNHNAHRWIQLNLVVDILFTRVQVATFPFIDSYMTLMLLFSTEVLTLAWRYYNGIDRLALWWNAIWMAKAHDCQDEVKSSFGRTMTDITRGCFRAPIPHIAQLNLTLREKNFKADCIVRTLTIDTDIFDEESVVFAPFQIEDFAGMDAVKGSKETRPNPPSNISTELSDIEAACDMADKQAANRTELSGILTSNGRIWHSDETNNNKNTQLLGELRSETPYAGEHNIELVTVKDEQRNSTAIKCNGIDTGNEQGILPPRPAPKSDDLSEEDWEQRPLYHVVDSTGATVISIIVRINQQLSIAMVRNLPSSNHLNESFRISDERWRKAQIYGWTFIALLLILLCLLGSTFFRRLQGKKLSLSRVMSYLFKDHFWFFFLWLVSTGAFVCASMVNHFGADFSFRFTWISCPGQIAWPGCPI